MQKNIGRIAAWAALAAVVAASFALGWSLTGQATAQNAQERLGWYCFAQTEDGVTYFSRTSRADTRAEAERVFRLLAATEATTQGKKLASLSCGSEWPDRADELYASASDFAALAARVTALEASAGDVEALTARVVAIEAAGGDSPAPEASPAPGASPAPEASPVPEASPAPEATPATTGGDSPAPEASPTPETTSAVWGSYPRPGPGFVRYECRFHSPDTLGFAREAAQRIVQQVRDGTYESDPVWGYGHTYSQFLELWAINAQQAEAKLIAEYPIGWAPVWARDTEEEAGHTVVSHHGCYLQSERANVPDLVGLELIAEIDAKIAAVIRARLAS